MSLTIKDIARESGYSVSTVSRVLNNHRDVSPEARTRIMEIVDLHNFVLNSNARQLKQTVSMTIAVVVKGSSNMMFASIVEEIQRRVEKTKYTVSVYYLDEDDNEVEYTMLLCREQKPVGILFLGGNPSNFQGSFEQVKIPCVLVSNSSQNLGISNLSSVAVDDEAAAKCAVDYLIQNGHKKIGILGGDTGISYTSYLRLEGSKAAMEENGIVFDDKYYEKTRYSYESAYQAMQRLLKKKIDITAVFAMSDVIAIGAIRALMDENYRVPEDVSVIGFDGIELGKYYNPKLTTMKQHFTAMADQSVRILLDMVERDQDAIHELVPFELISGESVKNL